LLENNRFFNGFAIETTRAPDLFNNIPASVCGAMEACGFGLWRRVAGQSSSAENRRKQALSYLISV
jgi:hypothetical protein